MLLQKLTGNGIAQATAGILPGDFARLANCLPNAALLEQLGSDNVNVR